jgi:hypothetical protein
MRHGLRNCELIRINRRSATYYFITCESSRPAWPALNGWSRRCRGSRAYFRSLPSGLLTILKLFRNSPPISPGKGRCIYTEDGLSHSNRFPLFSQRSAALLSSFSTVRLRGGSKTGRELHLNSLFSYGAGSFVFRRAVHRVGRTLGRTVA